MFRSVLTPASPWTFYLNTICTLSTFLRLISWNLKRTFYLNTICTLSTFLRLISWNLKRTFYLNTIYTLSTFLRLIPWNLKRISNSLYKTEIPFWCILYIISICIMLYTMSKIYTHKGCIFSLTNHKNTFMNYIYV